MQLRATMAKKKRAKLSASYSTISHQSRTSSYFEALAVPRNHLQSPRPTHLPTNFTQPVCHPASHRPYSGGNPRQSNLYTSASGGGARPTNRIVCSYFVFVIEPHMGGADRPVITAGGKVGTECGPAPYRPHPRHRHDRATGPLPVF